MIKVFSRIALWKQWIAYQSKAQRFVSKIILMITSRKGRFNFGIITDFKAKSEYKINFVYALA